MPSRRQRAARTRSAPRSACGSAARCPSPCATRGTARRAPPPAPPAAAQSRGSPRPPRGGAASAKVSAPSGVKFPATQWANQSLIGWPSCTPKRDLAQVGRRSAPADASASAAISAVTRARDSGELTIVAMPRLRSRCAADRACASPVGLSGISTLPCDRPCAFQSVSPWRRYQNGTCCNGSSRATPLIGIRPPGLPAASSAALPDAPASACRCAAQFAGSSIFSRAAPQNST